MTTVFFTVVKGYAYAVGVIDENEEFQLEFWNGKAFESIKKKLQEADEKFYEISLEEDILKHIEKKTRAKNAEAETEGGGERKTEMKTYAEEMQETGFGLSL